MVYDAPIRLVPYDLSWPARFAEERAVLDEEIGGWATASKPGLASTTSPLSLQREQVLQISRGESA